jgi:Tfp pilus assembly protein PilF
MAGGGTVTNYYRPLPVTLFMLLYQLWGPSPLGYHVFAILCHAVATTLLFLWVRRLCSDAKTAFWTALLFAIHPLHNETVNYIDHVEGILTLIFGLGGLLLYAAHRRWLSVIALTAALLCKEEGVVLILFLAFYEMLRPDRAPESLPHRKRLSRLKVLWPHFSVLALYLSLKLTVFNFLHLPLGQYGAQQGTFGGLGLRLLTFARALVTDLRLFVWPTGLHFDRSMDPVKSYSDPVAWASVLGVAGVLWLLWRALKELPVGRYGLLCAAAAMLPYSGIVPFNNLVAEHFLYIPSTGLLLAMVILVRSQKARLTHILPRLALGGFLLFFIGQGLLRNRDWQDPVRLYQTTLKGNPKSFRAANNLGAEYFRRGERNAARKSFDASLAARPTYPPALNNVGAVIEAEGRLVEALTWYERSAKQDPKYSLAHKNRAGILFKLKRYPESEAAARQAVEAYAQYGQAWNLLGAALLSQGKRRPAAEAFERAVASAPSRGFYYNLARAYEALGQQEKALRARQAGAQFSR